MNIRMNFETHNIARAFYLEKSENYYQQILINHEINEDSLLKMDLDQLKIKDIHIDSLINNKQFISTHILKYINGKDFILNEQIPSYKGFVFDIKYKLYNAKSFIKERINQLEQNDKVESIRGLIDEMPENSLKIDLLKEIKDLEIKKEELLSIKFQDKQDIIEEIEISKHRADMFEKKTDIFLKFLDRESIASMIGSVLLLLMGICLLVMMFLQREPIKIVESAFLLILGYFFGHSKNSK